MSRSILITGATGNQGGGVVKALTEANADFQLLALTRNAHSASAQKLKERFPKVVLVEGDLDDPKSIFTNAKKATSSPIWGVFSVQASLEAGSGAVAKEETQGKALIDAALANKVEYFVYTSVDRGGTPKSDDNPTNVPHFMTKHNIEQHLKQSTRDGSGGAAMSWTILRPVAFYQNVVPGFNTKVFFAAWLARIGRKRPVQFISTDDIGWFGAQAFLKPDEWRGKALSIAGDEFSFEQLERVFKDKVGVDAPTTWSVVAKGIMAVAKDLRLMIDFFADEGYGADLKALREMHPEMKDFGTWLAEDSAFAKR